ncbi:hypothetical protein, partial [Ramlibacter sp.]|uniref:hypothetical protein n=1 Tax=Ramlibacter sp. TaxID=1917967 RepID=UPI002FC90C70
MNLIEYSDLYRVFCEENPVFDQMSRMHLPSRAHRRRPAPFFAAAVLATQPVGPGGTRAGRVHGDR